MEIEHTLFILVRKWPRYRPGVAQWVGKGVDLLFHDRDTRRKWVVSSTPRPQFTPGKVPVPILQEVGLTPGPIWTGWKSRPHREFFFLVKLCLYWYLHVTELTGWLMFLTRLFVPTLHSVTGSRGESLRGWQVFAVQRCTVPYSYLSVRL